MSWWAPIEQWPTYPDVATAVLDPGMTDKLVVAFTLVDGERASLSCPVPAEVLDADAERLGEWRLRRDIERWDAATETRTDQERQS